MTSLKILEINLYENDLHQNEKNLEYLNRSIRRLVNL